MPAAPGTRKRLIGRSSRSSSWAIRYSQSPRLRAQQSFRLMAVQPDGPRISPEGRCPTLRSAIIELRMRAREVQLDDRRLALISKALGDPTRFQILQKIGESSAAPTCSRVREW